MNIFKIFKNPYFLFFYKISLIFGFVNLYNYLYPLSSFHFKDSVSLIGFYDYPQKRYLRTKT